MEREQRRLPRRPEAAVPGTAPTAGHSVLAPQRSAGNQAVVAMLHRQIRKDATHDGVQTPSTPLAGRP